MEKMISYQKMLPVYGDSHDVVVVGGGSAGICAAIAAARSKAKVLLVEKSGMLGGIGTVGAMVEFGPIVRNGMRVLGGIPYELMQCMLRHGGAQLRDDTEGLYFAPETFAHVAMKMCLEAGVELLLHTRFIDCVMSEKNITGIIVDTKEGMFVLGADVFIDCSGDGDVFFKAGAPFDIGRQPDGLVQPMTLVFFVDNVNYRKFLKVVETESGGDPDLYFISLVRKARSEGKFNIPIARPGSTGPVPRYGRKYDLENCEVFINGTNIMGVNGTKARDLTEAEIVTREQVYELFAFLRHFTPGFENCHLSYVPSEIGVRETRRLRGRHILTGKELLSQKRFSDVIAVGFNMIDIHQVAGHGFDLTHFAPGEYYDIPYGSLVCKAIDNLIVAGRCLSADHEALGAVRVMVNSMPIGQAAGHAASLAAQGGCATRDIEQAALVKQLRLNGAILGL